MYGQFTGMYKIKEDMHIHSSYSDGKGSLVENILTAQKVGLERICLVDHVRRDTEWLSAFVSHIENLRSLFPISIFSGAETKLLNTNGLLDVPPDFEVVDYLYVADHQFPSCDGPVKPTEIRKQINSGLLKKSSAIEMLVESYINALNKYDRVVIAHPFSILPKIGLTEKDIPKSLLAKMAKEVCASNAQIEIDERWRCPTLETVKTFMLSGCTIIYSTDSHKCSTIGVYDYGLQLKAALNA